MNQGAKTTNDQYYITHQKSFLSNKVTESVIYVNYSYTSCVNWEIEKTPGTPLKKLDFNIDKPESGLKKIDFNIITNNDEIDDMNNNETVCPSDNLTNDVYSNTNHQNVQQKQATYNSLNTLANYKLQLNYDLEDPYGTNDWKITNSHKNELIIHYNNKDRKNTLHPKVFHALYIKPNCNNNGCLIYDLSRDKIVVTTNYQSVPVPVDLFAPTNRTESSKLIISISNHL